MSPPSPSAPDQRQRFGSSLQVVLVASPPALLQRMSGLVGAIEGTVLAGAFATPADAMDDVVRSLQASRHGGTIVGVCAHLWREERERCAAIGVTQIVEKGDLIAFQGELEMRSR